MAGIGHSGGLSTMLVPGAGEPNYDSFVADPFQSYKARREQEVAQLLDKLPPESITLDPSSVGAVGFPSLFPPFPPSLPLSQPPHPYLCRLDRLEERNPRAKDQRRRAAWPVPRK